MPETREWFAAFYERNYKLVYRLCFTYMKNQAEAEDCTEDVFVKVLTGEFTFHDEAHEKKAVVFSSLTFLPLFLPCVMLVYFLVPKRAKKCDIVPVQPAVLRMGRTDLCRADDLLHRSGLLLRPGGGEVSGNAKGKN